MWLYRWVLLMQLPPGLPITKNERENHEVCLGRNGTMPSLSIL